MTSKLDRIKQMFESQSRVITTLPAKSGANGESGIYLSSHRQVTQDKPLMVWQVDETKFFSENRQKKEEVVPDATAKPAGGVKEVERDNSSYYISAQNNRRNPDMIIPGGAIKGNMYFKKNPDAATSEAAEAKPAQETEDEEAADEFSKIQKQTGRYYTDDNVTIKCHNCHGFGHMARECPNERRKLNCILCGKDTHESFACDAKLCFKCNKRGHQASVCTQTNVAKCLLCGQVGHVQLRCLKVWSVTQPQQRGTEGISSSRFGGSSALHKYKRCIQCQSWGHFKCNLEAKTNLIKLTFTVENDLDEFFVPEYETLRATTKEESKELRKRDKKRKKKKQSHRRLSNSNILIPTSDEGEGTSESIESSSEYGDSSDDQDAYPNRTWQNQLQHQLKAKREHGKAFSNVVQCSNCAGYHDTAVCTVRRGNRYTQYDNVRTKYANDMPAYSSNYRNIGNKYARQQQHQSSNQGYGSSYEQQRQQYSHNNSGNGNGHNRGNWQDQILGKRQSRDHQQHQNRNKHGKELFGQNYHQTAKRQKTYFSESQQQEQQDSHHRNKHHETQHHQQTAKVQKVTSVPHKSSSGGNSGSGSKHEKVASKESKKSSKYDPRIDLGFGESAYMAAKHSSSSHKNASAKDDSKKQSSSSKDKDKGSSVRRVKYVSVHSDDSDEPKMFKSFTKNASKKISSMKSNKALTKSKSSDKRGKR